MSYNTGHQISKNVFFPNIRAWQKTSELLLDFDSNTKLIANFSFYYFCARHFQ